jgi:FMN phosphatase YigB (HAD superfamily)
MSQLLASFDVFDTLLSRTTGSPESTFLQLGHRLRGQNLIACSGAAFASLRAQAEQRAFENAGGFDSNVQLTEIYAELALGIDIDASVVMAQELRFEREHLHVIEQGRQRLEHARRLGQHILFTSDMYLNTVQLGSLLDYFGLRKPGDQLLVSSDYGASKRSGALFRHLRESTIVDPAQIVHHGNDRHSDIGAPTRLGFATNPFLQGNLNRYEQMLDQANIQTDGLSGLLAGAARLSRLSLSTHCEHNKAIIDTSCSVAAPLVIGFVLWTLKRAMAANVKRLFFIARDGQLLLSVAQILAPKIGCDIELKYIYGSRRAWQLAAIDASIDASLYTLIPSGGKSLSSPLNVTELLDRFDLKPNEVRHQLSEIGIEPAHWTHSLSAVSLERVQALVKTNQNVRELITSRAERAREQFVGYLQANELDQPDSAIIDLGTGGTLFNALAKVLTSVQAPVPRAYYLGQRETPHYIGDWKTPEVYLYNANLSLGHYRQRGLVGFLEMVCSADHGTTIGYQQKMGEIRPVLSDASVNAIQEWGHTIMIESIANVARTLAISQQIPEVWQADIRAVSTSCFALFWNKPNRHEAAAWGSFPFDDGNGQFTRQLKLAAPYSISDAWKPGEPHRHWWHQGALALSGPAARWMHAMRHLTLKVVRRTHKKLFNSHSPIKIRTLEIGPRHPGEPRPFSAGTAIQPKPVGHSVPDQTPIVDAYSMPSTFACNSTPEQLAQIASSLRPKDSLPSR